MPALSASGLNKLMVRSMRSQQLINQQFILFSSSLVFCYLFFSVWTTLRVVNWLASHSLAISRFAGQDVTYNAVTERRPLKITWVVSSLVSSIYNIIFKGIIEYIIEVHKSFGHGINLNIMYQLMWKSLRRNLGSWNRWNGTEICE